MFCMRVMVGVIILYDHVHPVGAFSKTSKIDVRTILRRKTYVLHAVRLANACSYFSSIEDYPFIESRVSLPLATFRIPCCLYAFLCIGLITIKISSFSL